MSVTAGNPVHAEVLLSFQPPLPLYLSGFFGDHDPGHTILKGTQLPSIGEWTRIEMSHEEVDGKYFLSFSVGGREAGRMEAGQDLKKLTDVKVTIGHHEGTQAQPGFVRRLVILEKR